MSILRGLGSQVGAARARAVPSRRLEAQVRHDAKTMSSVSRLDVVLRF